MQTSIHLQKMHVNSLCRICDIGLFWFANLVTQHCFNVCFSHNFLFHFLCHTFNWPSVKSAPEARCVTDWGKNVFDVFDVFRIWVFCCDFYIVKWPFSSERFIWWVNLKVGWQKWRRFHPVPPTIHLTASIVVVMMMMCSWFYFSFLVRDIFTVQGIF